MSSGNEAKEKSRSESIEEIARDINEYLWQDLYETRRKLMESRKAISLEELLLSREG